MNKQPPQLLMHLTSSSGPAGSKNRSARELPESTIKIKPGATGPHLWSLFWQEFGPEKQVNDRCYIPGEGQPLVDRHWAEFAAILPPGARVIDLGCGAGIAGRSLLAKRSDLQVDGVDWADVPAICVPNLSIHRGVCMEDMPFPEATFDAAISLFGAEYGTIAKTARELQRVLRPGARYSLLLHHRDSDIVGEGRARRTVLEEFTSTRTKTAFCTGDLGRLEQTRRTMKMQHPSQAWVDAIGGYLRRNINSPRAEREAIWQKLMGDLRPEIALLTHLDQSAKAAAHLSNWLGPLLAVMATVSISTLRLVSGKPLAWSVAGLR